MRATHCIVHSKKRGTWHLRYWDDGIRKSRQIGDERDCPTLELAKKAAAPFIRLFNKPTVPFVKDLAEQFKNEKMSERFSTRRSCESRLKNHIIPKWGDCLITDVQARPVDLWLQSLTTLTPKSRVHIRGLLHQLWDFAQYCEYVSVQRNPMELVTIKNASKRQRKPRSLTPEEFPKFLGELADPVRTIALVCVSFGLRVSECLGLQWADVNWLERKLSVRRGIVRQRVGDLKTETSERTMAISDEMLDVFKAWRKASQFTDSTEWMFASPVKLGRLPVSYPYVLQSFQAAAKKAKLDRVSTHCMRHTYRAWLDAVGTPIAVQQKLMRHADIRTTMNTYGDVVTDQEAVAHKKVVEMALRRAV